MIQPSDFRNDCFRCARAVMLNDCRFFYCFCVCVCVFSTDFIVHRFHVYCLPFACSTIVVATKRKFIVVIRISKGNITAAHIKIHFIFVVFQANRNEFKTLAYPSPYHFFYACGCSWQKMKMVTALCLSDFALIVSQ